MPPGMARNVPESETPPEGIPAVAQAAVRNGLDSDDDETSDPHSNAEQLIPTHNSREFDSDVEGDEEFGMTRISDVPPSLPGIDIGGDIELPSRVPSKISARSGSADYVAPSVPRKNPRRMSQRPSFTSAETRNPDVGNFYDPEPRVLQHKNQVSVDSSRLPFDRSNSKRHSTISTMSSIPTLEDHGQENHPQMADDSPTSVGRVHHHSIRTITDHNPRVDLLGSSAEIVDERRSGSSHRSYENA
jgi:hypothetical protein